MKDRLLKLCAGLCTIGLIMMLAGIYKHNDYVMFLGLGGDLSALVIMSAIMKEE